MRRFVASLSFFLFFTLSHGQPKEVSIGIFSGITSPYTFDSGIGRDSRYEQRYQVKLAPIGVWYGVDYQGFGFVLTPGLINVGQDMNIVNTAGGFEGTRSINLQYLQLPLALKLHVIDLAFFKVSVLGGISAGYLINGKETITHNYAKFRFPADVYPILPTSYIVEYDGVIAPATTKLEIVKYSDFKKLQAIASFGFRSDWDFSEDWRIAFDLRANYGINEPRTSTYLTQADANQRLYELGGQRKELFASLTIGIARYFEVDKQKEAKSKSSGKYKPQRTPYIRNVKRKPKR